MSTANAQKESKKKYPSVLVFKVSEDQRKQIQADAQAYGKSLCAYVRDRMTGKRVYAKTDAQMLSELRRIGAGLIHYKISAPEASVALERLRQAIER
jgi:predicted HicB family RNase H-like nuclease